MANQEQLDILKQGVETWNQWRKEHHATGIKALDLTGYSSPFHSVETWNQWRKEHQDIIPDLSKADLSGAKLDGADLSFANLRETTLSGASLSMAKFESADLSFADLSGANLDGADLSEVYFNYTDLSFANLSWSNICEANLSQANLTGCRIYAISAWNVTLEGATQSNLIITDYEEKATITVDNLEVAQFIYLLLNNPKIREVIDTVAKKAVLILGRFTPERKAVLDALREALRQHNYLPVLFDFEKPASRDLTETISTLAHLSRFVIADLTDAKSIPQELMAIVPTLPSLAVQPLILASQLEYGMFEHFTRFPWVLPVYLYQDQTSLLASLNEHVITPAEQKAQELEKR